jgi:hypothetical protein
MHQQLADKLLTGDAIFAQRPLLPEENAPKIDPQFNRALMPLTLQWHFAIIGDIGGRAPFPREKSPKPKLPIKQHSVQPIFATFKNTGFSSVKSVSP